MHGLKKIIRILTFIILLLYSHDAEGRKAKSIYGDIGLLSPLVTWLAKKTASQAPSSSVLNGK